MNFAAPDIIVVDHGPVQPFKALPSGTQFVDHIGNMCIKIDEINGNNSITFRPVNKEIPQACWLNELAPVHPIRLG